MLNLKYGNSQTEIDSEKLKSVLTDYFNTLGNPGKILIIPPDITRFHSRAGEITCIAVEYFREAVTDILPALGTHTAMTDKELDKMFPGIDKKLFRVHNWKNDLYTLGIVPQEYVSKVTEGKINSPWPAQVNRLLVEGNYDLIFSIGQVVPHEVIGMANYNKNIFVGTGGKQGIDLSHFIGAVCGMESIMGKADNPVRAVMEYASVNFAKDLPVHYIQTVVGFDEIKGTVMRGIFAGDDIECFYKAAELASQVNITWLEKPLEKAVVYLDPEEFRSTWLGNKSIYRTRCAMADGGELIVLGPGVKEFGEDPVIDSLIRKYGYRKTPQVMKFIEENEDLRNSLGVAAHLIHGSSEGRFRITYCPGRLSKEEIESAGYEYCDLSQIMKRYNPEELSEGYNSVNGEKIYFINNPALGLWSVQQQGSKE